MASKLEAKKKISELIDKYERFKLTEEYYSLSEEATCLKFILPLFHALGWDIEGDEGNMDEVQAQAPVANQKRVDYAFNINGQVSFFLEAKKLSEDLYNEDFAWQSINYGYNRSVKYVVLSDFEGLIVFNTTVKKKRISDKTVIKLKYTDFLSNLDTLWLLSKDSISNGKLNEYAKEHGHVENKVPINELLLSKLLVWRDKLMKEVKSERSDLSADEIHECVQKLLNRLIFIRTCEDRQIEKGIILNNILNDCRNDDTKSVWPLLLKTFRTIGDGYDSNLFEMHEIDKTKISSDFLWDVIAGLYEDPKEDVKFDFAVIPDDILGKIYEQYLGIIQKGENLAGKEKRKSHGIYYTPKFIVDYIVENTLGKVLDELLKNKEYSKIGNLKVLDPACGSGSFLIKALQRFDDVYAKTPAEKDYPKTRKLKALASNIYGVDLDAEAVELTKLNLLLSAVSARKKLPNLDHNIECGNSLIDDPKVAGDKAFDWKKRFPEVMDKGNGSGFDVIIGNPPYVNIANIPDLKTREYLKNSFKTAKNKSDLYSFFAEKAINLLKDGGALGLIFSNSWMGTDSFSKFREYLLNNTKIVRLVKLPSGVFEAAQVTTILLFLIKEKAKASHSIELYEYLCGDFKRLPYDLSYKKIMTSPNFSFSFNPNVSFKVPLIKLGDIAKFSLGVKTSNDSRFILSDKKDKHCFKLYRGKDVYRYYSKYEGYWLWYKPELMMQKVGAGPRKPEYFQSKKIMFRSITGGGIIASYDDGMYFTNDKVHILYKTSRYSLKFILAVVNSKLINLWIRSTFGDLLEIKINQLQEIPIPKNVNKIVLNKIEQLTDKMLQLQKNIVESAQIQTAAAERLKQQINDIDKEIDVNVYKLYELSPEEI